MLNASYDRCVLIQLGASKMSAGLCVWLIQQIGQRLLLVKSLCNSTEFGCTLTEPEQNLLIASDFQKTLVSLCVHVGMPGVGLLFRNYQIHTS